MSGLPTTRGATGRGAHSGYEGLAKGLGWFSLGLGIAELLAPRAICRALGMEGKENLVRGYGARECATGIAILMSHDPTPWIWGRVAGDGLDLATLASAYQGDDAHRDNLTVAMIAVAGVAALDIACVQGLTADKRLADPEDAFDYGDRSGFPRSVGAMRGAARDLDVPADFRIPEALRPWRDGKPEAVGPR